ncbi:MAG: SoxR reducing system RseC family protein [Candidatus Azobacteroides sp.]|nr:SoxR reducing system RseC family protein [Candidatus Azobacteroides sp.]
MNSKIEHPGVIQAIYPDMIVVKIEQVSACAGCHAQNACSVADKTDKLIEVPASGKDFSVNDTVCVTGESSMGLLAVWYAFGLPLILLFSILFFTKNRINETYQILLLLGIMVVYYLILYLFREKMKNRFVFHLKKTTEKTNNLPEEI